MVMIGAGVEVSGDQYLVFVAPHPLCQLYPQPVAQLRGNFSGLKALLGVVGHIAARLAKPLLDRLHLLKGGVPITVHAGDEHGPSSLRRSGEPFANPNRRSYPGFERSPPHGPGCP